MRVRHSGILLAGAVALTACEQNTSPSDRTTDRAPSLATTSTGGTAGTCTLFAGIIDVDWQGPFADIVSGGWLNPDYFGKCLGSEDIIAVTWTFADPADLNHDGYADIQYIEQYSNAKWG